MRALMVSFPSPVLQFLCSWVNAVRKDFKEEACCSEEFHFLSLWFDLLPCAVAFPELVSRGVSKSRKFKWLVKVGACKDVNPLIKKIMAGGVSGQPENPPGYATDALSLFFQRAKSSALLD